MSYSVP